MLEYDDDDDDDDDDEDDDDEESNGMGLVWIFPSRGVSTGGSNSATCNVLLCNWLNFGLMVQG